MRDFAKISCSIWHSRKFRSLPNDDCRLVYLYLHTNPHVNSLGCYVLPFGYAIADLGWNDMETDPIRYRDCIEALCDYGLIGFDPAGGGGGVSEQKPQIVPPAPFRSIGDLARELLDRAITHKPEAAE